VRCSPGHVLASPGRRGGGLRQRAWAFARARSEMRSVLSVRERERAMNDLPEPIIRAQSAAEPMVQLGPIPSRTVVTIDHPSASRIGVRYQLPGVIILWPFSINIIRPLRLRARRVGRIACCHGPQDPTRSVSTQAARSGARSRSAYCSRSAATEPDTAVSAHLWVVGWGPKGAGREARKSQRGAANRAGHSRERPVGLAGRAS